MPIITNNRTGKINGVDKMRKKDIQKKFREELNKKVESSQHNTDETINRMGAIIEDIRQTYINKRAEYLSNPYWGFEELLILLESKLIKMKQSTTAEKRKDELVDIAVYCIMTLALKKHYDRKKDYPLIYE